MLESTAGCLLSVHDSKHISWHWHVWCVLRSCSIQWRSPTCLTKSADNKFGARRFVVRNIAGDSPDVRKCDLSSCYSCLGYALLPMVAFSLLSILLPRCAPRLLPASLAGWQGVVS